MPLQEEKTAEAAFQRSPAFEEAAKKLQSSAESQFKKAQEEDKGIQAALDFSKAAATAKVTSAQLTICLSNLRIVVP